jgi:hypothetical protein
MGSDLITKVYPSDVIPDQFIERKRDYRPNNFLGGMQQQSKSKLLQQQSNQELGVEDDELEIELTLEEFQFAVEMTEASIRRLTKAHIIDLRNIVKPHHLVEKVLNMVCILRGCIAPSWTMARELMASMTFKLELVLLDASKIKQSLVRRVVKLLSLH